MINQKKLIKSIVKRVELARVVSGKDFENIGKIYEYMNKYKGYLRIKLFVSLGLIAPFITNKLIKMAYVATLGSKSLVIKILAIIDYSLLTFFFFLYHIFILQTS